MAMIVCKDDIVRPRAYHGLAAHLRAAGVATSIYYPLPLHLQPALAAFGGAATQFPRAEAAAAEVLALPIYPELSDDKLEHVCGAVRAFYTSR